MRRNRTMWAAVAAVLAVSVGLAAPGRAEAAAVVVAERVPVDRASATFKFENVPTPSADDAATGATFALVGGRADTGSGGVRSLNDGRLPASADEPAANCFFRQRADGGRVGVDLGAVVEVERIGTYSWHKDTRGPQVYKLYAADGTADGFDAAPKRDVDPAVKGWKLIASVDTRPKDGPPGGQYGVSISGEAGAPLGKFRHLLIDASATETADPFGNTFFSEIDVVARKDGELLKVVRAETVKTTRAGDGRYEITIDTAGLDPAMAKWAEEKLRPVCEAWYPKIVEMLPSEGYEAPRRFGIVFRDDMKSTPAAAAGTRVMCNRQWFEKNRDGEAVGAVVHEMVHVVQQYGRQRGRPPVPFWLQEGIPDYIRWFLYEPEKRGAEIRNPARVKYDNAYRVSGNFLNWATAAYDKQLVAKVNAAIRSGKYDDALWKELTGKTLDELDAEWKAALAKRS